MLHLHLSYKTPRSWRILFRSGGHPRQFSRLKKFRALVVPGGGFRKGITQGMQLPSGLPVIGQSCLRRKGDVIWVSVHSPIQRNSTYVHTVRMYIYETRRPEHPHLPIHRYQQSPQRPPFTVPLQAADLRVRVFGMSGLLNRPSYRLYIHTITLSGWMDRLSNYKVPT